jgi:hypothetical protein
MLEHTFSIGSRFTAKIAYLCRLRLKCCQMAGGGDSPFEQHTISMNSKTKVELLQLLAVAVVVILFILYLLLQVGKHQHIEDRAPVVGAVLVIR